MDKDTQAARDILIRELEAIEIPEDGPDCIDWAYFPKD